MVTPVVAGLIREGAQTSLDQGAFRQVFSHWKFRIFVMRWDYSWI